MCLPVCEGACVLERECVTLRACVCVRVCGRECVCVGVLAYVCVYVRAEGGNEKYVWAEQPGFCGRVVCAECLPRVYT